METLNPGRARLGGSVTAGFDMGSNGKHVGSALMMIITTTAGFTTHHRHNP